MLTESNKEMTNEEFDNCFTLQPHEFHRIDEELQSKGILDIRSRLRYVNENYDGQRYMAFALKALDNVILKNYQSLDVDFVIRKDSVDGILRSFLFAMNFMPEGLPQHAYGYIKSKSSTLFDQLIKLYEENNVNRNIEY